MFALPVVEIELSRLSSGYSPRTSGEDPEHVETLLSAEGELPPILVHRPTMQVLDGLHRVKVARVRGDTKILARLVDGTEPDAFVLAVEANVGTVCRCPSPIASVRPSRSSGRIRSGPIG